MKKRDTLISLGILAALLASCGGQSETQSRHSASKAAGGTVAAGNAGLSGTSPGGSESAGTNQGGTNQGGTNQGGTNQGGTSQGGTNQGGTSQGGTNQGGASGGGAAPSGAGGQGGDADCAPRTADASAYVLESAADVEALRGVTKIPGTLVITGNVDDLSPLGCLEEVEALSIQGTERLRGLEGLENLTRITGVLMVWPLCDRNDENVPCRGNAALESVVLPSLEEVGSVAIGHGFQATVSGTPVLERIGLDRVKQAEFVDIIGCPRLVDIGGFGALSDAMLISILDNTNLETISGFGALTDAGVSIHDNPKLVDVSGFSHLRSGSLALGGNALTSVDAFSGLVEVTSLFIVESSLTSLRGFEGLTGVGTLSIHDNASLPSCEVDWLLAHVGAQNIDLVEDVSNNTGTGTCPP